MSDGPMSVQARALATFGVQAQLMALSEELCEASAAIARLANGKGGKRDVVEEIVDVESVVLSLREWLADADEWASMREQKSAKLAAVLDRKDMRRSTGEFAA